MTTKLTSPRYSITIDNQLLPVLFRKHPTSRRIIIRYQSHDRFVCVTLPRYATIRQGLRFVEEKQSWIAAQMQRVPVSYPFEPGQIIPVLGVPHQLVHIGGRGVVTASDGQITVPGEVEFMARRVRDFLRKHAQREIEQLVQHKASLIGVAAKKIVLRDTRSHWGSCTHRGHLSFSWRLVLAPYEVLDYVVAHEVAHLAELNHSPRFWRLTQQLCPQMDNAKGWLSEHGDHLHRYG
ncbi:MAG: SprT family zinc-dependent metalloprotease [Rickettsiales bacterium]|nr:SprT family zinc-dependent metalloprotease [Rickettsiales bacterium]